MRKRGGRLGRRRGCGRGGERLDLARAVEGILAKVAWVGCVREGMRGIELGLALFVNGAEYVCVRACESVDWGNCMCLDLKNKTS